MFNGLTRGSRSTVVAKFTALIVVLCLFIYGLKFAVSFFSMKPITIETMQQQVAAMNAKLPENLGPDMQLTHIVLEKNTLIFSLITPDSNALRVEGKEMKKNITTNICTGVYFKSFLQSGGRVEYHYSDHHGKLLSSISVDQKDCH